MKFTNSSQLAYQIYCRDSFEGFLLRQFLGQFSQLMKNLPFFRLDGFAKFLEVAETTVCDEFCSDIANMGVSFSIFFESILVGLIGICKAEVCEGIVDGADLLSVVLFELLTATEEIFIQTTH